MHVQCIKCNSLWGYIYPDTPLVHNHILGICTCMHVLCIQCTGLQGCTQSFMVFLQKDVHSIYTAQQLGGGGDIYLVHNHLWGLCTFQCGWYIYTIIYMGFIYTPGEYVQFLARDITFLMKLCVQCGDKRLYIQQNIWYMRKHQSYAYITLWKTNVCIYNRISGAWKW